MIFITLPVSWILSWSPFSKTVQLSLLKDHFPAARLLQWQLIVVQVSRNAITAATSTADPTLSLFNGQFQFSHDWAMFRLISVDEREKAAQQTSIKSINVGKLLQIELTQLPISNLDTSGQLRFLKGKGFFHNFTEKNLNLTKEGLPKFNLILKTSFSTWWACHLYPVLKQANS